MKCFANLYSNESLSMKRLHTKLLVMGLMVGLLTVAACDSFLDESDPNTVSPENFLVSTDNFNAYLTGIYAEFRDENELVAYRLYTPMLQGAGLSTNQSWTGISDWNEVFQHNVTPANSMVGGAWDAFYEVILQTNDVITQGAAFMESEDLSQGDTERMEDIIGQAHFLRGLSYFYLVRFFGVEPPGTDPDALGVPIVLEVAETRADMDVPRSTVGEVYDQILADFQAAEGRLPPTRDNANLGRPTQWAAKGFVGKAHLYMENWSEAASYFREIVDSGPYMLADADTYYNDMWHEAGDFASGNIFEWNFLHDTDTNWWGGGSGHFVAVYNGPRCCGGFSNFFVHQDNITRFGDDPRLRANALEPVEDTLMIDGVATAVIDHDADIPGDQWSVRKNVWLDRNVFNATANGGSNLIVMRLADVMLMLAEALMEQGMDAEALDLTNQVRQRAYANTSEDPTLTGLSGEQLREAIYEERFLELHLEGHRWFDMQRWERVEQLIENHPSGVKSGELTYSGRRSEYWPIPQSELDANTAIQQSPDFQ